MKIGITGGAGFIGMHLVESLIQDGEVVVSVDNFTPSYGTNMARVRANYLQEHYNHVVLNLDVVSDYSLLVHTFENCELIVHLSAWPGISKSQTAPHVYFRNNVVAFNNILNLCEINGVKRLFYASSSSVYGDAGSMGPVKESDLNIDSVKSYYATTKLINEIDAHKFPFTDDVSTLALRFFTVFGPWGRPDMAYWKFAHQLKNGEPIILHGTNGGIRNFTYISDVIQIIKELIKKKIPNTVKALNIANSKPIDTVHFLKIIEEQLNISTLHKFIPTLTFDSKATWADQQLLQNFIGTFEPTSLEQGIGNFISWLDTFES